MMRYDANKDGWVDKAEWKAGQEARFKELDTNKDGVLSREEFMAAAPQTAGTPNGAALVSQLDKNKDGKVTADEFRAPILARFDKMDTNHDGVLSATERQAAQAQAQAQQKR